MEEIMKRAEEEDDDVVLPGFRFHPTDEELVGFYLRRKVQKRPLSIEIIKEIDIYKHDPWDLPKAITAGEKESYFFCPRGRKYRNSIRPNRVTGSGFWKATGIDRPIQSAAGSCIGLKKSLVYYRGSAGKGSKTDWMMHEFRLPDCGNKTATAKAAAAAAAAALQDTEVWTICRIFKRSVSYKKQPSSYKVSSTAAAHQIRQTPESTSSITSCFDQSDNGNDYWCSATSYTATAAAASGGCRGMKLASDYPTITEDGERMNINSMQPEAYEEQWISICQSPADPSMFFPAAGSTVQSPSIDEFFRDSSSWDELGKLAEFMAADESLPYEHCGLLT